MIQNGCEGCTKLFTAITSALTDAMTGSTTGLEIVTAWSNKQAAAGPVTLSFKAQQWVQALYLQQHCVSQDT